MGFEPSAILAISSTDRYINYTNTTIVGRKPNGDPIFRTDNNQPTSNILESQYNNSGPYANDFSITAPTALINGYIDKIIISQIQLQYYLPTIIPGRNDLMSFYVETSSGSNVFTQYIVTLPYGFYSPSELATMLQIFMNIQVYGIDEVHFTVNYRQGNVGTVSNIGFTVSSDNGRRFYFPNPGELNPGLKTSLLKTYKVFGFNINNSLPQTEQYSWFAPVFLYTPYIDIYSDALTNYQALKDTDSSTIRRKGLLARVYLSGVGNPQVTTQLRSTKINLTTSTNNVPGSVTGSIITDEGNTLGAEPFVLTYDMNSPKVINWTPDTAVNSLDFQTRDCYGDLLFTIIPGSSPGSGEVFNTEFQMTLLCVEG